MNKWFVIEFVEGKGIVRAAQSKLSGACNYWKKGRVILAASPENLDFAIERAKRNMEFALDRTDYFLSMNLIDSFDIRGQK